MSVMRCVTGDIPIEKMGFCQPHEHLFVAGGPGTKKYPSLLANDVEKSTSEVDYYAALGGNTIIDAQPAGAGGDFIALKMISRRTKVNIVATCGFHLPMFYAPDHEILTCGEGALFDRFTTELETAGAVKVALGSDGLTDEILPRFRAAARAAAKKRVPVIMHTHLGYDAIRAIDLMGHMGVEPKKIMVCHVDRQTKPYSLHESIAKTGAVLEYDTIGRFKYHDDDSEVKLIQHMLSKGYKLTLSLDTTSERMLSYSGNIGLGYLIENFIPRLISSGVSKSEIDRMTRENPADVFK